MEGVYNGMIIVVVTNKNMTEQSSSKKGEGAQKVFLLKWIRNFSLTLEIYFRDEMIQDSMLAQGGGGGGGDLTRVCSHVI